MEPIYYEWTDRLPTDRQRRDEALLLDAWLADNHVGLDALMLAPTRALVADLKDAARAARLNGAQPGRETALSDGNRASRGDVIITRRNNRTLTSGAAWVRNGDRWRITSVHRDGAQGVTADTCHGLLTGTESRQQAYTMLSRGRYANHAWVQVSDVDHHTAPVAQNLLEPSTATQLLESVVERDDAPVSVTTLLAQANDPVRLLGPAVTCYLDQAIRRTRLPHHQLHQARSCPNEHLGSDHTRRPGSSPTSRTPAIAATARPQPGHQLLTFDPDPDRNPPWPSMPHTQPGANPRPNGSRCSKPPPSMASASTPSAAASPPANFRRHASGSG